MIEMTTLEFDVLDETGTRVFRRFKWDHRADEIAGLGAWPFRLAAEDWAKTMWCSTDEDECVTVVVRNVATGEERRIDVHPEVEVSYYACESGDDET